MCRDADPQDLLLLDDLLGIADPDVPLPQIDPDARRRRLTAMINTASLARTEPALYIIEDAHWIDAVSESMLADFLTVIPRTPSMVLITSRPEYEGALTRVHGAQTIALAPLADSDTATLLGELLGSDPSVAELAAIIAERAAGNPFFAEEMVRELVQRGVLAGERGGYVCRADVAEVSVPATVQAAIEARIDRLSAPAKQTLNAASVIGARFGAELLAALGIDAVFDELLERGADRSGAVYPERRVRLPPPADPRGGLRITAEIRSRPVAPAPGRRDPRACARVGGGERGADRRTSARPPTICTQRMAGTCAPARGQPTAISPQPGSAGSGHAASPTRLPADDPDQLSMRIAPRTMLCATDWQAREVQDSRGRFAELRELCTAAGDNVSLAIGMTGLATELVYAGRSREGSRLASEQMALLESIGDPTLTMGLASIAFCQLALCR